MKRKIADVDNGKSESSSESYSTTSNGSVDINEIVDTDRIFLPSVGGKLSESQPLDGQQRNYSVTFRLKEIYEQLENLWKIDNLNLAELEKFSLQDFHMDYSSLSTLTALDHNGK